MSSGISFRPDQVWLVRSTLADPITERVARMLAPSDPDLAEWVEQGIVFQSVALDLLEPAQREQVRLAVVDVVRELVGDDDLLRSIAEPGAGPDPERDAKRRETVQRLLDLAESDEARRFAAGEPT
jgi:hypothetical protein